MKKKKLYSGAAAIVIVLAFSVTGASGGSSSGGALQKGINEVKSLVMPEEKPEQKNSEDMERVNVSRVIDGDTVEVKMPDGEKESVRLLLIDTPESVHPDKPEQPYGEESSEFAEKRLTEGKKVRLEYDGPKRDNYGRLLAYIWTNDKNFNQEMLEEGYARYAYEYEPPYKYQDEFKEAEKEAEEKGERIWSIDGFVESEFEEW